MTALNWNSRQLTRSGPGGRSAFFKELGFQDADFGSAQVGIGVPLLEGNAANSHAQSVAQKIKEGCAQVGMIGLPFGVPSVSDTLTYDHEGGQASLPSRNMIASAAEMVASAHCYDALVGLHHCDKNGPGFAMALARLNFPGLIVGGGTSPTTFNTWGIVLEALGLMLPNSASLPATSPEKSREHQRTGASVRLLLERNLRPRDILTHDALHNATATLAAIGGSTNGILHLLAVAREAGLNFTLSDVGDICRRTPLMCRFAPRGRGTMSDLHQFGGTQMLLRRLAEAGVLRENCLTVTGRTHADNLYSAPEVPPHQDLIARADTPFSPQAQMQVCFGNLAPHGIVCKMSSPRDAHFRGRAVCFESIPALRDAVAQKRIPAGAVIVLRWMGPVACGMPEINGGRLAIPGLDGQVAVISDARISAGFPGPVGVHCSPEAAVGGPIALVRNGDDISLDLLAGKIIWHVAPEEIARRQNELPTQTMDYTRTYLSEFAATTSQAHLGCGKK